MRSAPPRVATVLTNGPPAISGDPGQARLATALLAGSPRVAPVGSGACRVDARGWERRGGEPALVRTLRRATLAAGLGRSWVGVADVAVAADAAAVLAKRLDERESAPASFPDGVAHQDASILVPPSAAAAFLSPLPLFFLPISDELRETLRTLGFHRIGEVAGWKPGSVLPACRHTDGPAAKMIGRSGPS